MRVDNARLLFTESCIYYGVLCKDSTALICLAVFAVSFSLTRLRNVIFLLFELREPDFQVTQA